MVKRVIVTGGAGFIGSHTARFLHDNGMQVLILDNFSTGSVTNLDDYKGAVYKIDIRDDKDVFHAFREFKPHAVLHLAAQSAITTAWENPQKDLLINALGTLNIAMAAKKYGVRMVFSSTSAVYREDRAPRKETWDCSPSTPYGISKLACEGYIRAILPDYVILRYGNVYGPLQQPVGKNQVIARAFRHFLYGDSFSVDGDGSQKRDFVYVSDVVRANYLAILSNKSGTYNVATGKNHSVKSTLRIIGELYGVPEYGWDHTLIADPRGDVGLHARAIRRDLKWQAQVGLKEGLQRTFIWWNERDETLYSA